MERLKLVELSPERAEQIREYIASFPEQRERVTYEADRIPGLDRYEEFGDVDAFLAFCESMRGNVAWYMTVRESDSEMIGAAVLRSSLEYDDDDEEFASHIGYSVRPDERGKGYATEQLRLVLGKARELGLEKVRLVCLDTNTGSNKVILNNGGVFIDVIHGEDSGMDINRYDIIL